MTKGLVSALAFSALTFLPAWAAGQQDDFETAVNQYKQGDYAAAAASFEKAAKTNPQQRDSALYYEAISLYNIGQKDQAIETARRISARKEFYQPTQTLIKSLRNETDEYLDMATTAFQGQNFELCLEGLKGSVLADGAKGKDLKHKCKLGMELPPAPPEIAAVLTATPPPYRLYANSRFGYDDNMSRTATVIDGRPTYYLGAGGEYLVRSPFQYGLGASYEYNDSWNYPEFRSDTYNVYVPMKYQIGQHEFSPYAFYDTNSSNGVASYSEVGLQLNYNYHLEKYLLGLSESYTRRFSRSDDSIYQDGYYNSLSTQIIRFAGPWSFGVSLAFDINASGDIPYGFYLIPERNNSLSCGLTASYSFSSAAKLTAKINFADADYTDNQSTDGVARKDLTQTYSLTYLYTFSQAFSAYLSETYTDNGSTYVASEIEDKNYNDNLVALGLSLTTF